MLIAMSDRIKITVVGAGYVGLANAVLLAQHNDVVAFDTNADRVALINQRKSPSTIRSSNVTLRTSL